MSAVYEAIGRLVVTFVRYRFRNQIRIALGGYLALSRDVKEG